MGEGGLNPPHHLLFGDLAVSILVKEVKGIAQLCLGVLLPPQLLSVGHQLGKLGLGKYNEGGMSKRRGTGGHGRVQLRGRERNSTEEQPAIVASWRGGDSHVPRGHGAQRLPTTRSDLRDGVGR